MAEKYAPTISVEDRIDMIYRMPPDYVYAEVKKKRGRRKDFSANNTDNK